MIPLVGLLALGATAAAEEDETSEPSAGPPPWTALLSLSGAVNQGNLDQVQARARGQLHATSDSVTSDTRLTWYRLWQRPEGAPAYVSLGDDFVLEESLGYWFTRGFQLNALARYEFSQLNRLDLRLLLGAGAAVSPVRGPDRRVRFTLGALAEHARYPGEEFRLDIAHEGGRRTLARLAVVGDGFLEPADSPLSLRYTALVVVNPADVQDFRVMLDGTVGVTAWGPFGLQLAATYTYSSVVLAGVDPNDLQLTAGVTLTGQGRAKR